jgi:hypothetical protein
VIELISRWLRAVCSHNVDNVLSLYCSDAVLLGTFAAEIKQGQELVEYFRMFLGKTELCGQIDECIMQETVGGPILSGIYTFWWIGPNGPEQERARFTFVFTPSGDDWLILNHHSSLVPEGHEP